MTHSVRPVEVRFSIVDLVEIEILRTLTNLNRMDLFSISHENVGIDPNPSTIGTKFIEVSFTIVHG
jgi:hypothetical protein